MRTMSQKKRSKAGRPRKEGVERTPSGQISRAKRERADIVALQTRARHADITLDQAKDQKAATFIGILMIKGVKAGGISSDQYDALEKYEAARQDFLRAINAPGAGIAAEGGGGGSEISDGYIRWCSSARQRWDEILQALRLEQEGNRTDNLVGALNACVSQGLRLPHLVGSLRIAANCLARHFRG